LGTTTDVEAEEIFLGMGKERKKDTPRQACAHKTLHELKSKAITVYLTAISTNEGFRAYFAVRKPIWPGSEFLGGFQLGMSREANANASEVIQRAGSSTGKNGSSVETPTSAGNAYEQKILTIM
jgi:hypothetical protein